VHEDGGAWFPLRAALELGLPAPVRSLLQGHGPDDDAVIVSGTIGH
jgi:phosphate starvation-inducible membrane PsiE